MCKQHKQIKIAGLLLSFCLLIIFGALNGEAQSPLSSIVGTVRDSSGAVVVAAKVTATDEGRGYKRSVVTDSEGNYIVDLLLDGVYSVSCEMQGFKTFFRRQIPLLNRQVLRIDVTLELGEVSESITVGEAAPLVASETGTVESAIGTTAQYLKDIPKNELIIYIATLRDFSSHFYGYKAPSAHSLQQRLTLEGVDVDSAGSHIYANFDIKEFKLQYSGVKAESTSPIVIDMALRGGSNKFHGIASAEFFFPSLSAIGPFPGNPRPHGATSTIKYWQGSGPIYIPKLYDGRDRTFFSISRRWESYTELGQSWSTIRRNVPPFAWRDGDFSSLSSANFSNTQKALVNPFTGVIFPGNIIPTLLISPVSAKAQQIYHVPNNVPAGDRTTLFQNYKVDFDEGFGGTRTFGTWAYKFDHRLTERDTIGITHHQYPSDQTFNQDVQRMYYELSESDNKSWTFYWTRVISPNMVNELRGGIQRVKGFFGMDPNPPFPVTLPSNGYDQLKQFGITWQPAKVDPSAAGTVVGICIPGVDVGFCGRTAARNTQVDHRHILDNLSIRHGNHNLKLGFDYRPKYDFTLAAPTDLFGLFQFSGRFTGFPYADFLLGLPDTSSRGEMTPKPYRIQNWGSGYFQDDWKVSPKLTLEMGLRVEHIGLSYEKNGMMVNFDPATASFVVPNEDSLKLVSPLFPQSVFPIKTAAQAGFPERLRSRDQPTFYPRLGFAFRPFSDARTVVRGGYGTFLVPATLASSLVASSPFALSESFRNDIVNGQPLFAFPYGFPTQPGTIPGQTAFGVARDFPFGYTQNWNLTIEREILSNTSLRLSYIGSKSTQMPYQRAINKPQPSLLPYDNNCASKPAGTCTGPVFPKFGAVNMAEAGGNGNYHGFGLEFKRRWASGLSFVVDYSFSKAISDVDDAVRAASGDYGNFIENPYDRARDRGVNFSSLPHRLLLMHVWDIPVGRGRQFLSNVNGIGGRILDTAIGGWTFSSLWNYSGRLSVTPLWAGADTSHTNTSTARPDVLPGCSPTLDNPTVQKLYNSSCFVRPSEGRFGNAGRSSFWGNANADAGDLGNFLSPDFGFYKYTSITPGSKWAEGGLRLRIGFKMVNAFNHPSLAPLAHGLGVNNVTVSSPATELGNIGQRRRIYVDIGLDF